MKCELCHKRDAETAIVLPGDGEEQELYVCRDCAKQERVRRQKKSQRTRKTTGIPPEMSISVTRVSGEGEAPPPIIEAIMNAVHGMVSDLEKAEKESAADEEPKYTDFPCERIETAYRIGGAMHLEGLNLIGELEAVGRAVRALKMQLVGIDADGVRNAGHVFRLKYAGAAERARRVVEDILAQERNARARLVRELPRVFGDSLCRALAVMKNCRLLAPGEFFDLLSTLRLGALEKMFEGITLKEIDNWLLKTDLSSREDSMDVVERDKVDADRADEMNRRFEDVVLNERAEEMFL